MRKIDRFTPADPMRQDAWHKARLELKGFMVQNKHQLSRETIQNARVLYGPEDQAKHKYPSWSVNRGWYVELVYGFIADCRKEIERYVARRKAA